MKALKILGILLLVFALIVFALNMMAPKEFKVERSTTVNAPAETTFSYLKCFEKMNKWSPWAEKDPNMKDEIKGTDCTVGAIHSWEGNDDVGVGSQEIVAIEEGKRVDTKLLFMSPWESKADAYFLMEPEGEGQKVTWGFTGTNPFPTNVFMMLMGGLDKLVGPEYEKGLAKLKTIVEADKSGKKYNGYSINLIDWPETHYLGTREEIEMADIAAFYTRVYPKVMAEVGKQKGEMAGMPSGLYFSWDEKTAKTDLAGAIPLKAKMDAKDFKSYTFPACKALQIDYYGDYGGIGKAHEAIEAYLKENGKKAKVPCVEEYVTDPTTVKNPEEVLTKLTYMLEG